MRSIAAAEDALINSVPITAAETITSVNPRSRFVKCASSSNTTSASAKPTAPRRPLQMAIKVSRMLKTCPL